jgi:sortase A
MGDTSWPGLGSNTGLAGHVDLADGSDGPFRYLADLEPGDEVILYTQKRVYTYRVRSQVIVEEDDLSVVAPTEKPQITLITCVGWDAELRLYLQRLVVYADLINTRSIQNSG